MPTQTHSIRTKITLAFVCILTITILSISFMSYFIGKKLLKDSSFNALNSIRTIKIGQVSQYMQMLSDQCLSTSESTMIADAMETLKTNFNLISAPEIDINTYKQELATFYKDQFLPKLNKTAQNPHSVDEYMPVEPQTIIAQTWYLAQNPQSLEKKIEFARANIPHPYNSAHEKYHTIFKRYAQRVGIADLYLVDLATGYVVYSLTKEIDFGTNLISGPLKNTGLGKSFLELQKTTDENFIKIIDFQFYDPSYGTPVGFISTPIFSQGKKIGGLIFKFPIDTLNDIMTYNHKWQDAGLGKTGESYLIGEDKTMRTIARPYIEDPTTYIKQLKDHGYDATILDKIQVYDTTVLLKRVNISIIRDILGGKTDTVIIKDTMGTESIFSYSPIKIGDIDWYILIKISSQEAFEPIQTLLWYIILYGILAMLIGTGIAFALTYIITKPLTSMMQVFSSNAENITRKLETDDTAEFASIGESYNTMIEHIETIAAKLTTVKAQIATEHHTSIAYTDTVYSTQKELASVLEQIRNASATIKNYVEKRGDLATLDATYATQIMTLQKLISTTIATITEHVNNTARTLRTHDIANVNETKLVIEQTVQECNNISTLLLNAENSYKQMDSLLEEIKTKEKEKKQQSDIAQKATEEIVKKIEDATNITTKNKTATENLRVLLEKQGALAEQIDTIIKEIHK